MDDQEKSLETMTELIEPFHQEVEPRSLDPREYDGDEMDENEFFLFLYYGDDIEARNRLPEIEDLPSSMRERKSSVKDIIRDFTDRSTNLRPKDIQQPKRSLLSKPDSKNVTKPERPITSSIIEAPVKHSWAADQAPTARLAPPASRRALPTSREASPASRVAPLSPREKFIQTLLESTHKTETEIRPISKIGNESSAKDLQKKEQVFESDLKVKEPPTTKDKDSQPPLTLKSLPRYGKTAPIKAASPEIRNKPPGPSQKTTISSSKGKSSLPTEKVRIQERLLPGIKRLPAKIDKANKSSPEPQVRSPELLPKKPQRTLNNSLDNNTPSQKVESPQPRKRENLDKAGPLSRPSPSSTRRNLFSISSQSKQVAKSPEIVEGNSKIQSTSKKQSSKPQSPQPKTEAVKSRVDCRRTKPPVIPEKVPKLVFESSSSENSDENRNLKGTGNRVRKESTGETRSILETMLNKYHISLPSFPGKEAKEAASNPPTASTSEERKPSVVDSATTQSSSSSDRLDMAKLKILSELKKVKKKSDEDAIVKVSVLVVVSAVFYFLLTSSKSS